MIITHKEGLFLHRTDKLGEREWREDPCYKVIYSPLGEGLYQTPDGDKRIHKNSIFVTNPYDPHKQLYAREQKMLVEINPALISRMTDALSLPQQEPEFARITYRHPHIK